MKKITPLEAEIQTVIRELEALSDDALEAGLNFPMVLDDDFLPEVRRDHSLRQELAREVLAIRKATPSAHQAIERPKTASAEDLAVPKRTMCQHVDVRQPDGNIFRFHIRVPVPPPSPAHQITHGELLSGVTIACATNRPEAKARGLLGRIWRWISSGGKPLTSGEIWSLKRLD
jgi:hypothetical protein